MSDVARIDKYLWAIRVYKTRSEATEACKGNKVQVNGVAAKPSRMIKIGDMLSVRKGPVQYSFKVLKLLGNRVGAQLVPEYAENLTPESELAKASDYQIIHGFFESYGAKIEKMGNVLGLACEILNTWEGYEHYEEIQDGLEKIYDLINKSVSQLKPRASEFGINYKDMDNIYVMSSGASAMVAYSFSMFLMLEMQQIPSPSFNDGNFFHGPFELVDKDVPYLLLMNDGPTRPMDSRAMEFIQRFDGKLTVVDAKDFGLGNFVDSSVIEYFNPLLLSGVLRLYAEELAEQRSHPLTLRKYMWKIDY